MSDLKVTLIQTPLHWEDIGANLRMLGDKIHNIQEKTEIVILPEMFNSGFSMNPERLAEKPDGKTTQWMRETAKKKKVILTGSIIMEEEDKYFNRLIWMYPNGQYAFYDKRHLFSYSGEDQHFYSGTKKLITQVNGWKIFPVICYDLRFPVWLRQPPEPENQFDLLICIANWPEKRDHAWSTLLQARAIENQCFAAGVNITETDGNHIQYAGNSCIIDPLGKIMNQKCRHEAIISCTLQKEVLIKIRKEYPFLKDADNFIIQK